MKVTFAPRGIIQIDEGKIIWPNFAGRPDKFNREGDRNFTLLIDNEEVANALVDDGWNVKIKPPREEGDSPFMHLQVKVKFNGRGPNVYLESGGNRRKLDEEGIAILDDIDIAYADMDIRPFDWDVNGKTGRTAYLHSACIVQDLDRFARQYADDEYPEE